MDLSSPFPLWLLRMHRYGAVALVVLVLLQKEVVRAMAAAFPGLAARRRLGYGALAALHRRAGYAALVALAVMDGAGFVAGSAHSAFPGFRTFSYFFAAPFALWLLCIWLTAATGWLRAHAFLSNMLLKGCIATPLSRLGGAALQRLGWPTAAGYYVGIFGVACAIGLWQAADCVDAAREVVRDRGVWTRQKKAE